MPASPLKNVVIVSDYAFVNGGASRVALSTANALAGKGLSVHLFAAVGPVADGIECNITCLNETPYNESSFRRSALAGLWDRKAEGALSQLLAQVGHGGTVVHFHSNRDALSSSVFAPVFRADVPTVYTCHEYGLACPYSSFFDHKTDSICTRKPLSASCIAAHCNRKGYDRKLWTVAKQIVQNSLLRLPERLNDIVYVSEFSRRILEPYIGEKPRQHTLPNPTSFHRGSARKIKEDAPFLFVGLLTPGKGPVIAAQAAKKAGVPMRFVGDGDAREAVETANPEATVTGWLPPGKVRDEMAEGRALVLPALWYETQGLVVQEAASVGLPSIATETCAASETIDHGCNGLLVPAHNPTKLAEAMSLLMDDRKAEKMGRAAYEKFWENPPTMESHLDSLLTIYTSALEANR